MTESAQRYHTYYNTPDPARWGRTTMDPQRRVTLHWLNRERIASNATVVELGCGFGALSDVHKRYVGVELAREPLLHAGTDVAKVNADMQSLPFRNSAVDFLFSWAALEHVPNPELVLEEIERVMRVGGVVLLAPAWNVRSWAAEALPIRPYAELSLGAKLNKFTIPLRNSLLWRGLLALPRRLSSEMRMIAGKRVPFSYRRLTPNLESYTYTDCDAFTSMDSHTGIAFFLSRGWKVLSHPTTVSRLLSRHEPVVAKKL